MPYCARPNVLDPKDMRSSLADVRVSVGVRLILGCMHARSQEPKWFQIVLLSPIFNEILAFELKHKNKTKSIK